MNANLAVVVGAAVGALGGLGGGWLSVLGQLKQHARQQRGDRERWRDEMRRNAYNDYIASTKQLSAAWWRFSDKLRETGSTPSDWQDRFLEAHEAWAQFSTAAAAVSVAGPRVVAEAADDLRRAMSAWETISTDWHHEAVRRGTRHLEDRYARFKAAAEAKRAPDRAFQLAARRALGTDD